MKLSQEQLDQVRFGATSRNTAWEALFSAAIKHNQDRAFSKGKPDDSPTLKDVLFEKSALGDIREFKYRVAISTVVPTAITAVLINTYGWLEFWVENTIVPSGWIFAFIFAFFTTIAAAGIWLLALYNIGKNALVYKKKAKKAKLQKQAIPDFIVPTPVGYEARLVKAERHTHGQLVVTRSEATNGKISPNLSEFTVDMQAGSLEEIAEQTKAVVIELAKYSHKENEKYTKLLQENGMDEDCLQATKAALSGEVERIRETNIINEGAFESITQMAKEFSEQATVKARTQTS